MRRRMEIPCHGIVSLPVMNSFPSMPQKIWVTQAESVRRASGRLSANSNKGRKLSATKIALLRVAATSS